MNLKILKLMLIQTKNLKEDINLKRDNQSKPQAAPLLTTRAFHGWI
jgi:hypothetical protein